MEKKLNDSMLRKQKKKEEARTVERRLKDVDFMSEDFVDTLKRITDLCTLIPQCVDSSCSVLTGPTVSLPIKIMHQISHVVIRKTAEISTAILTTMDKVEITIF